MMWSHTQYGSTLRCKHHAAVIITTNQLGNSRQGRLLPCRVYLVGGAQAQGKPEDTAVVYTPSVLDNGIYMSNITLPPGMFWSDVIESPGAHASL